MTKNRIAVATTIAAIVIGGGIYAGFRDYFPPVTGRGAARWISGLAIPRSAHVDEFMSNWTKLGAEGSVRVRLRLDSASFERLMEAAVQKGYQPLPSVSGGQINSFKRYTLPATKGLFVLDFRRDGRHYKFAVLEVTTRMLHAEVHFN